MSAISRTDYISPGQPRANITFQTSLETDEVPDNATVVEVVGTDFYQALGSVYEPFRQGRAAMVVGAF